MEDKHEMIEHKKGDAEILKKGEVVAPDVDIYINEDEILLIADLPGVAKNDLSINLEDNTLTIEGHFDHSYTEPLQKREFESIDYRRVFTLPKGIDTEKAVAEFKLGVLQLHLPKSAAVKPRQIKVETE
jgi:HSP20 family molecular chaperone IbpA